MTRKNQTLLFKKILKSTIINLAGVSFAIVNDILLKTKITIFVYHDISNEPSEFSRLYNLNVPPELFEFQIKFIKKNFKIISPDNLLQSNIPSKAALITFDDGFLSYFKNAIPILEKYEIPSIIFLNMEPIKGGIFKAGLILYLWEKRGDFRYFVENSFEGKENRKLLFLLCSRNLIDAYVKEIGLSFEKEVCRFVGEFSTERDLLEASIKPLVFYGNHFFNHDVPLLLTDEELLDSYLKNADELKTFPNYRNMLSLPFGQPGTCFSSRQINLLLQTGVEKIFSSSGNVNSNVYSPYLDRVPLDSLDCSTTKIWFQICQKVLRSRLKILN